ncbi:unnamed protein product [Gordionus sp. m RMFG-2023]
MIGTGAPSKKLKMLNFIPNSSESVILTKAGLFNKLLPCIEQKYNPNQALQCETLPLEIKEKFDLKTGEVIGYEEVFNTDSCDQEMFKDIPKNIPDIIDDAEELFDFCFPKHKIVLEPFHIKPLDNDEILKVKEIRSKDDITQTLGDLKISKDDSSKGQESVMDIDDLDPKLKQILNLTDKDTPLGIILQKSLSLQKQHSSLVHPSLPLPSSSTQKGYKWARSVDLANDSDAIADFKTKLPSLGHTWPFELDDFQKHAILKISKGETVLVAAHTSAGKTVIAEYAIALAKRNKTRVVYTSPIKALSNQKFRDFKKIFGEDIGLITGDVCIKSNAFCLIMTTEILKVMLYTQDDLISELEWVIFDEVHYINDEERGVVWEEVFILLPPHVKMIFLSATAPNALEFADWIGSIKHRPIYVIYTSKRPVPLEHYLYITNLDKGNRSISYGQNDGHTFMIVDSSNNFLADHFKMAKYKLDAVATQRRFPYQNHKPNLYNRGGSNNPNGNRNSSGPNRRGSSSMSYGNRQQPNRPVTVIKDKSVWINLIEHCRLNNKLPAVVFLFSRKRIDTIVQSLDGICLTDKIERNKIEVFVKKCVAKLNPLDQELPQVRYITRLLSSGLGVHHSGILPLLKEMVEFLFHQQCIKVLFATETFATGLNMPAKTVVFETLRKFDGSGFRNLNPAEYVQMAGRAGRRGMDTTGSIYILCKDTILDEIDLKIIMLGTPAKLESKFYLNYSMILHLLQNKNMKAEDMMKRSFAEFYNQANTGNKLEELKRQIDKTEKPEVFSCTTCLDDIDYLLETFNNFFEDQKFLMNKLYSFKRLNEILNPGRVIIFKLMGNEDKTNSFIAAKPSSSKIITYQICMALVLRANRHMNTPYLKVLYVLPIKKSPLFTHFKQGNQTDQFNQNVFLLQMLVRNWVFLNDHYLGGEGYTQTEEIGHNNRRQLDDCDKDRFGTKEIDLKDVLYLSNLSCPINADEILSNVKHFTGKQRNRTTYSSQKDNINQFFAFVPSLLSKLKQGSSSSRFTSTNTSNFYLEHQSSLSYNNNNKFGSKSLNLDTDAELEEILKRMMSMLSISREFKCVKTCSRLLPSFESWPAITPFHTSAHSQLFDQMIDCHFKKFIVHDSYEKKLATLKQLTSAYSNNNDPDGESKYGNIQFLPEYEQRIAVLKKLEYIDENHVALMKGRVACCITNAELIITELLFWNYFENLSPEIIVGILSCLVCQEKHIETPARTPELVKHQQDFLNIARKIADVEMQCKIDSEKYLESFNFSMMEVVYHWALGKSFKEVATLTTAQEGAIVRCIQRLEEICHNVRNAARIIGETNLYKKMEEASFKIKRDIVFAASLYTVD